ncbi:hypothetical protein B0H10DRAFT_1941680 [Mycena sp. CBHHK59/15]|nr:hypothetical protein B0H10DRAFT_1941680 [Mycena sp. CBHHK59/15]
MEESVGQQKMSFNKAIAPKIEELKDCWPVNDEGKRIYTDEKGFQWELTPIQLNVWGAHMARGMATVDKAPVSGQFNVRNHIKSHQATATNIPPPVTQPITTNAPAAPAPPSATDKLIEMLAISMLHQQQQQQHAPIPPIINPPAVPPPTNQGPIPSAPQSPEKPCHRSICCLYMRHEGIGWDGMVDDGQFGNGNATWGSYKAEVWGQHAS